MSDLELTKLCAEAMGLQAEKDGRVLIGWTPYWPLHDDAHAFALLKRFTPALAYVDGEWWVKLMQGSCEGCSENLNRAIVECVAKMQAAKP